jgi:hypothetical protein
MNTPTSTQPTISAQPAAASEPRSAAVGPVVRGLLRQPRFLVAAGLLLVCAVGFNVAATSLQLHFRKSPVPLPVKALDDKAEGLPSIVGGRWVQISEDRPLNGDVEKALGTKQYLNRIYVDRLAAHKTESDLKGLDERRAGELVNELQTRQPEAVIHVHMAYYTGLVDTVAHIPDRCMVADGFRPSGYDVKPGPTVYADGKARDLRFRFITFEDTTAQARVTRNVGYLFKVNGLYTDDPFQVRKNLQDLTATFGYYAKVELMTQQPSKGDDGVGTKSARAMTDFLAALMPQVDRCLPDWDKVTGAAPAAPPATR